jgi:beta-glucosidase
LFDIISISVLILTDDKAHKFLPTLEDYMITPAGKPGWTITFYNHDRNGDPVPQPISSFDIPDTKVRLNDFLPKGLTEGWTTRHKGFLIASKERGLEFEIGLAVAGKARVWVDGKMVIELWEEQEPGEFYYG